MLESVVERLLSRYLAQYVRGISRDKLSVAVWSGNVELEDLQVKPEVSDLLGIPFRVIWGRVQKIKLTIPWSRLGTAPVCVEVAGLHVLLEPKPIPEQSDAQLIEQLRDVKRRQVEACEQQMHDARLRLVEQQQQQSAAGSTSSSREGDGGFFFRFVNKILSNLLVDIRDVHIALVDPVRGFSIGALLAQASIHNTDAAWGRHEQHQQQRQADPAFYKACELSGLAVYCALDGAKTQQSTQQRRSRPWQQEHHQQLVSAQREASPETPPFPVVPQRLPDKPPAPSSSPPPGLLPPAEAKQKATDDSTTIVDTSFATETQVEGPHSARQQGNSPLLGTLMNKASAEGGTPSAAHGQVGTTNQLSPMIWVDPTEPHRAPEGLSSLSQKCKGSLGDTQVSPTNSCEAAVPAPGAAVGTPPVDATVAAEEGRAPVAAEDSSLPWTRQGGGGVSGRSQYVLKPLHLRLTLSHTSAQQELVARLEVLRESQGIEIGRSQLEALLAISNEAAQRRQRCEQLLLRQAHTVMLGTEGLEGTTQREFIGLYSRQLQTEAGIRGVAPLSHKEKQRLVILHDVVGVRHLAKWRNICTEATNRVLQQTQLLQQQQQQQLLQQQRQLPRLQQPSWWQWVTGRQSVGQLPAPQQQAHASGNWPHNTGEETQAPLLTSEDIQLIVDAVQSDKLMQSVSLPTKYVLTFELEHFCICLKNDSEMQQEMEEETAEALREAKAIKAIGYSPTEAAKALPPNFPRPPPPQKLAAAIAAGDTPVTAVTAGASLERGGHTSPGLLRPDAAVEKAFLSVELFNLCAALDLLNKQDAAGRDSSEWSFCISLSNVAVRQQSHLLMHFRRDGGTVTGEPVTPAAAGTAGAAATPAATGAAAEMLGVLAHHQRLMMLRTAASSDTIASSSSSNSSSSSRSSSSSSSWSSSSSSCSSWSFSRGSTSVSVPPVVGASSLTAARLELRHDLTPTGNILGVFIRLAPLVAEVKPELLRTLCDFFVFETPADVRRFEEEEEKRSLATARAAPEDGSDFDPADEDAGTTGANSSKVATEVDEMRKNEFVEGLRETGETVYSAAVQHLPDLVQLDLLVAAPILNLDGKGAGSIALHLGTLSLRSDGACPYDALRGVLEFNETRLICAPTGHKEVSILRPIPIRMHVEVLRMKEVSLNILFEEIFLELTPEAIGLLIAVPASMAKSLLQVRPQQASLQEQTTKAAAVAGTTQKRKVTGETLGRSSSIQYRQYAPEETISSAEASDVTAAPQRGAESAAERKSESSPSLPVFIPSADVAPATLKGTEGSTSGEGFRPNDGADECMNPRNNSSSSGVEMERKPQMVFTSTWLFGRCGFLIRGLAEKESAAGGETCPPVLQAELTDLLMQLTADSSAGKCGAVAELHQVLVSDPSTNSPLFLSLHSSAGLSESTEWGTTRSSASLGRCSSLALRSATTSGGGIEDEEFHDAVEDTEKTLRVELEVLLGRDKRTGPTSAPLAANEKQADTPKATLAVTSLPVELHWRQQSLRRILQTLADYRQTIRSRLQQHLDELSEVSAAALGPRGLLSRETVAAVHDTLQTVQQTLSFGNECEGTEMAGDIQRSNSGRSRTNSATVKTARIATGERDWLQKGLEIGGELPPLTVHRYLDAAKNAPGEEAATSSRKAMEAQKQQVQQLLQKQMPHVSLELTLTFREVAIAFYEGSNTVLARMALKGLSSSSRFYSNGDTETSFSVGDGGIVFRDRCVLGPRAAYRPPAHQQQRRFASGTSLGSSESSHGMPPVRRDSCETSPAASAGVDEAAQDTPTASLFTARVRQYGGLDPVSGAPFPYSMCLEGQMEQICFVYRQKDVSRTLNYLRDGIFDVFISKSYRAVKEAATASYCLFALDIQSPLFILAEDKEAIPGFVPPPGYRMPKIRTRTPTSPASAASAASSKIATASKLASDSSQMEVEVDHLGRFIVFDLGNLKVRNAYVPAIANLQQHRDHTASGLLRPPPFGGGVSLSVNGHRGPADTEGAQGDTNEGEQGELIFSDLRLEMRGMQISASDNGQDAAAGGCLLENVEACMLFRSAPTSLCIEAETTAWMLHLSRQQLTLIFDVINENICGQGYLPPAEVLSARSADAEDGDAAPYVDEGALRRELEIPPLAVDCLIVIPQLTLEASYGPGIPLALLSLHCITAKVAASVSRLVSCYRFLLCAEAFSIDDLRAGTANYFKRVASCTAPVAGGGSDGNGNEWDLKGIQRYVVADEEGSAMTDARNSFDRGQDGKSRRHDRDGSPSIASPHPTKEPNRARRVPGVEFEFGSSLRESYMDFQFSGVTVYVLVVAFMDILSYFTSSWAFSSMRSYPKPLPTLLKGADHQNQQQSRSERDSRETSRDNREVPLTPGSARGDVVSLLLSGEALRERPFRVSVSIQRGCFVVYSDLQSPSAPVIVWSSDFLVRLKMKGDETIFERVQVLGSKICRLDASPLPKVPLRSQSHVGVFTGTDAQEAQQSQDCLADRSPHRTSSDVHKPAIKNEPRTVRWGTVGQSESSKSSNDVRATFDVGSPGSIRQRWAEGTSKSEWQQRGRCQSQLMMREWMQLQQLQHRASVGNPSAERLTPRTDSASAVLLCEHFHLEGSGVYRSASETVDDCQEPKQKQQQQGNGQAADPISAIPAQSGRGRIPAAVHRMQQSFSAAAAKLPPRSISPAGIRHAAIVGESSSAASKQQQDKRTHNDGDGEIRHQPASDQPQNPGLYSPGQVQQQQQQHQHRLSPKVLADEDLREAENKGRRCVMTFVELSFDIPLFYLRVSSRDMALLLSAARCLHSDGPSVCPTQQPPPIRFPEACAQHQRQQQLQHQDQQEESTQAGSVQPQIPSVVERTAKISLCLEGAQLLLLDDLRSSVLPVLQLRLSAGGLVFDITSTQLQVALRDFCCGLDYLNAKAGCWEPFIEKLDVTAVYRRDYAEERQQLLQRQQAQVGALDAHPGEDPWGTFKAARTLMLHSQSPFWLNITPQLCELFAWFLPYLLAHLTEGGVPKLEEKCPEGVDAPHTRSPRGVPRSFSVAPLVPSTVSMLQHEDNVSVAAQDQQHGPSTGWTNSQDNENAEGPATVAVTPPPVSSSARETEAAFRYLNLTGQCLYAFTMQKFGSRSSGMEKEQHSSSSNSRSGLVNRVGTGRSERHDGLENQTVSSLLLLVPGSSTPLPLDGLMQSRTAEASRRSRSRQRFYITNCPPVDSVLRLNEMFPTVAFPAISRNVISSQDVEATMRLLIANEEMRRKIRARNLASVYLGQKSPTSAPARDSPLAASSDASPAREMLVGPSNQQQPQQQGRELLMPGSPKVATRTTSRLSEAGVDPSPPAIGPFPRGTKAVAVDSMRNCCVTLLPPVRHSILSRLVDTAAAAAALRGPAGTANVGATAAERFLGNSSKTVGSSSSSSKFASRQLQRLRSSLTTKDRRPSGISLGPSSSQGSTLARQSSAASNSINALDDFEGSQQPQQLLETQQPQRQMLEQLDSSLASGQQLPTRRPTGLNISQAGKEFESSASGPHTRSPQKSTSVSIPRPVSGFHDFIDADMRRRGGGGESPQQRSGEQSTMSSSFSAPLPLAHVDSHSEAICQVLSPHPSYKLLLLSTTVMLHNSSGMPLEICFLDGELNPLLLPASQGACAPLDAIGEPSVASKRGELSVEEPSSLHPDLQRIPDWMLRREERWREAQRLETLQQKQQLRLLLQDAATKPAGPKPTASAPLRRALTEWARLEAFTRSPSSSISTHQQEAPEECVLEPPTHKQLMDRLTYTFLLPNLHLLSVPQRAILGPGWCNVCFRPAAFAEEPAKTTPMPAPAAATSAETPCSEAAASECTVTDAAEAETIPTPPDMTCVAGWCDLIDTRHRMEGLRCRQSAYLPPRFRPGAASASQMPGTPVASGSASDAEATDTAAGVNTVRNLYFLVHIEGRKGALPAEKELKRVTIFPSVTLVNATTTELDINIAPSSATSKSGRRQLTVSASGINRTNAALQELHALQQRPSLSATLRRRSTFLVYEVPPNRPLRLRMRFAMLEGAEWSSVISDLLSTQDEVVSRVLLPSRHHASAELEVLHDTAEVMPFLPFVFPRQLVAVISAPRSFIDRTGLGVRPVQDGRFCPEFDGQSLLGDSTTADVTLLLPRRRGLGQPVECRISVPALGGYSHASLETEDRCYTLRLKTEKMDPSETAGAICRVVSLVPEFILTNALKIPLFFRQYGTPGPAFEVHPGQSYPVYWASAELPQAIQFRPGTSEGYAWSGAVVASEETAGKSWIALYNGMRDAAPGVFCVEVAPDGGVKSICIRGAEGHSEGFLVINKCPVIRRVMVHTYHSEMNSQGQSADTGGVSSSFSSSSHWTRQPMKLPDFDFHFFANEGETVAYGWPFPFTYTSRPCQVLLWIDSKTVAPRSPILLDLETPQYKRYEVNLGLPDMPQIIVRTEKRGDAMIIEVRPKPGTGPERAMLPSSKSQGVEPEVAVESPLRSLHVALTLAQVGVSLIYDAVKEELCFAELSQLAIGFQERGERQKLLVRIADIQIDNQMEHARKPVLLANRGGGAHSAEDPFSAQSASKPFLSLFVVRHHTTSSDVILRRVQLEMDNLEVEIDADALNGLNVTTHTAHPSANKPYNWTERFPLK